VSSKIVADARRGIAVRTTIALVASLASFASFAPSARAQATTADAAMAQSLFEEGRRLMAAQRFAQACPKLAESQRLDPALGTLLNLAVCHERVGRTATAWSEFHDAASIAKRENHPERGKYAREHIDAIEPRLSRLTITRAGATPEKPERSDKIEVRVDDALLGEAALGTPMTIDPGVHRIEARAPGKKSWKMEITIAAESDRKTVEIPALEADSAPLASPVAAPLSVDSSRGTFDRAAHASAADAPPLAARDAGSARRTAAYIAGGLGVVALGVGAFAGVEAITKWSVRGDNCVDDRCNTAGLDADKTARRWALVADIGIGAGIVGVGAGALLLLTARSHKSDARAARIDLVPLIGRDRAGASVTLGW
jgi:hypothetical protein